MFCRSCNWDLKDGRLMGFDCFLTCVYATKSCYRINPVLIFTKFTDKVPRRTHKLVWTLKSEYLFIVVKLCICFIKHVQKERQCASVKQHVLAIETLLTSLSQYNRIITTNWLTYYVKPAVIRDTQHYAVKTLYWHNSQQGSIMYLHAKTLENRSTKLSK